MNNLAIFILGVISFQVLKLLALAINELVLERRKKRFMRQVKIRFPDETEVTFIAVETSDKRAMESLLRKIEDISIN